MRDVQCVICKRMIPLDKAYKSWKRWWACSKPCYDIFQKHGRKILGKDQKVNTLEFKKPK